MVNEIRYWVVIPAAGTGSRMEAGLPKQYIAINGKTVIEYTLDCFLQRAEIAAIVVAIANTDQYWPMLSVSQQDNVITAAGGQERYQSVLNGLRALSDEAMQNDWVLVHDAARPCLLQVAIDRLLATLHTHDVGGILALPCRDTMKQANAHNEIESTIERRFLWSAQTPQMFRYGKLLAALEKVCNEKTMVTDEAMAMELSGYKPLLVQGHLENIKLTHKDDLEKIKICLMQAG